MPTNTVCNKTFGYIVAIQSFQHGGAARMAGYFCKAACLLDAGGLLFVRVNSANTKVVHAHRITESDGDGFTAVYGEGPKRGLPIRFLSRAGLERVVRLSGLCMVCEPKSVSVARDYGSWSQWEMIAQRQ